MPSLRLSRATRLGAILGTLACGAACTGVLGIGDRSLDPELAEGGIVADAAVSDRSVPQGDSSSPSGDSGGGADAANDVAPCASPCPIAMNLHTPYGIASDGKNVYWTEYGDGDGASNGYVKGCPIAGCNGAPTIYAQAQVNPYGIATDGASLYWSTAGLQGSGGGIWSCPVTGCTSPTQLASPDTPEGVAIDDTYVYWVGYYDDMVQRVPKKGGADTILWDAGTGGVNDLIGCAVDDASVYVTDNWTDLLRVPLGGGAAVTINNVTQSPTLGNWNVTVDPTYVYYGSMGGVVRTPKTATTPGPAIGSSLQAPWGVAIDPATGALYYADNGSGLGTDGTVGKIAKGGNAAVPLQSSLVTPFAVAVGGPFVFWTSAGQLDSQGNLVPGTGAIYRAPK